MNVELIVMLIARIMEELVYDIRLDWLARWGPSNVIKSVKWLKIEELGGGEAEADGFRMMVLIGGKGYKNWIEVRKSKRKGGFGLFAAVRFEKGDIITARVPGEEEAKEDRNPQLENLQLGWAVRRSSEELGKGSNAIYVSSNRLIRAKNRILAGSEILLDADMESTLGMEYLDCLVFSEPRVGWRNFQSRNGIGTVRSGDKVNGFIVQFDKGRKKVKMSKEKVRSLAVSYEFGKSEQTRRGVKRSRIGQGETIPDIVKKNRKSTM